MAIKTRARDAKPSPSEVDAFINQAEGTPASRQHPAPPAPDSTLEAWEARAATAKNTESQPLRHNVSQARLLAYAARVERRPKSQIIAELIWRGLEERHGDKVPLGE